MISNLIPLSAFELINGHLLLEGSHSKHISENWISPANLPNRSIVSNLHTKVHFQLISFHKSLSQAMIHKHVSIRVWHCQVASIMIILIISLQIQTIIRLTLCFQSQSYFSATPFLHFFLSSKLSQIIDLLSIQFHYSFSNHSPRQNFNIKFTLKSYFFSASIL